MTTWHDLIREARERANLSQAELAEKVGCSQATINKIENEKPRSSRYLLEIINQLGLSVAEFPADAFGSNQRLGSGESIIRRNTKNKPAMQKGDRRTPSFWASRMNLISDIPLFTPTHLVDDMYVIDDIVVGTVKRPPFLAGIPSAYALSTDDEAMSPECEPGDTLFINPHHIILPDTLCLLYCAPDNEDDVTFMQMKRFKGQTEKFWKVAQHNPYEETDLPKASWTIRHRIVGKLFR